MNKKVAFLWIAIFVLAICIFEVKPVLASSSAWSSKASMHVARASLGVAVVNGQVYAIGGVTDPPSWVQCTNANEKYDPTADRWVFRAPMPTPRASFATAVYNNKIYCIGGTTGAKNTQNVASNVNEVYDPAKDAWTIKASMPTARVGVTASVVDGKIYVLGGNSGASEVYDPEADSWTTKASMPVKPGLTQIWSCTSSVVDGKIHVIGAFPFSSSHQVYNPKTDSWTAESPIIQGYYLAAACSTSLPKRIYVFGVDSSWWDLGPPNFTSISYNPLDGGMRVFAMMPTPRVNAAVAVVNDLMYVIGGSVVMIENNAHPTALNEQYSPLMDQPADNNAPTVNIESPQNRTYLSSMQLIFSINKPTTAIRVSIDAQNLFTAAGNSTLTLQPGAHNVTVYAIDTYGNVGASETVNFSVNEPQPCPTLLALAVVVLAICIIILAVHLRKSQKNIC